MAVCRRLESLYEVISDETFLAKHSGNHALFGGFDTASLPCLGSLRLRTRKIYFLVFIKRKKLYFRCFVAVETLVSNVACAAVWDSPYRDHFLPIAIPVAS